MKKARKVPLRKCVATQEVLPKKELLRVVRTPKREVVVDLTQRQNGSGAYLKKSEAALELARKRNALAKALEIEIPETIYDELLALINES